MSETSFLERFACVQSELKAPKNRTNKFGGYKYRSCEDILKAAKPLLKRYDMVLTMTDTMQEIGGRVYVVATAVINDAKGIHTIQTSACAREAETKKGMDDSQITGTASSYARKYALNGLFCLDDVTDADSAKEEAEAYLFAIIQCADCGYNIQPFNDGNRGYTPVEIASMTKKAFKRELCWKCAQKAKKAREKKDDGGNQ